MSHYGSDKVHWNTKHALNKFKFEYALNEFEFDYFKFVIGIVGASLGKRNIVH